MFKLISILALILCLRRSEAQVLKGVTFPTRPYAELRNGKIEGFAADLIKEIAEISGFNYTLEFTPDLRYGFVVNNTINGMVGEVHFNRADFAVADIAVTDVRREYVDFTEPFIETNTVILIHKNNVNNIHSFSDLAEQTDTQYGTVLMGSTYHMMSQSTDPTLAKMYRHMTNNPDNLFRSLREGVERVNSSNFAAIVEKSFAEYIIGLNCDLTFIDDNNNYFPRQFAIAVKKDSNQTQLFNTAIKQMKENGMIDALRDRYWRKCGTVNGVTLMTRPYVEYTDRRLSGGFAMDLIKEISAHSGLDLKVGLTPDGRYGPGQSTNGVVSGMIGEVFHNRADFAIADITVTDARKEFVDFTEPFMKTSLAVLIHKNNANDINSFADLADQTDISYGPVLMGTTSAFFANSNDSIIQKMNQYITSNPNNYVRSLMEGLARVRAFPYAMITEKLFAEYIVGKDCDLTYISDDNQFPREYAIAVQKNSIYLDKFNAAIRELKSNGLIDILRQRYWKQCGVLSGVTVRTRHVANLVFGKIEGFVADLMDEISAVSGFNYSLYFTPDKKYGVIENNKINGMLGELTNYRADFAVADITVTDARKQFVDFTEPFLETRLAFLINKKYSNNITSFTDLSQQTLVKYGVVKNGSTHAFLKYSTNPTLQEMYRQMSADPEVFVSGLKSSIERIKSTPFAVIGEKSSLEFITGTNCDLTIIDDPAHTINIQFALALPKNSPHLEKFNSAIRQLKSTGRVESLWNRYKKSCGVLKGVTVRSHEPYAVPSKITGKLTGFAVDMMDEIASRIGYNYTLDYVRDGAYGMIRNNSVNGMVGEVYRNLADFAIADLTVTEGRKQFVDFTEPLIETGIAILIHKDNAINITSFRDLFQSDVEYGVIRTGSTRQLFRESKEKVMAEMDWHMRENPELYVSNSMEGVEKVNSSRFAYISEQSFAEYITGKHCDELTYIVDPVLRFPRNYAIALPKGSPLLQAFNTAITDMKTNGDIDRLRSKYWKTCEQ